MDPGSEKACKLKGKKEMKTRNSRSADSRENVQEIYGHKTDEYPEGIDVSILLDKRVKLLKLLKRFWDSEELSVGTFAKKQVSIGWAEVQDEKTSRFQSRKGEPKRRT